MIFLGANSWKSLRILKTNVRITLRPLFIWAAGANVAVKVIKDVSEQQFLNETNAEALSHRNIIEIVKIEKIDSDVVVLMQPWGSINLQQLLTVSTNIPWHDLIRSNQYAYLSFPWWKLSSSIVCQVSSIILTHSFVVVFVLTLKSHKWNGISKLIRCLCFTHFLSFGNIWIIQFFFLNSRFSKSTTLKLLGFTAIQLIISESYIQL